MKIKIAKSILENSLTHTINFTEKKDNSQITSHILIQAKEKITLKATDLEFGLEYVIDNNFEIITEGELTINGKKLYEIIKALNDDFIEIELKDDIAIISQNHSIYKLPTFDVKEYPEFPNQSELQKVEISTLDFIEGLKKVFLVIDTNNLKYELNGALLNIESNSLNIVATDTKRLALYSIKENSQKEIQIIIPKKSIAELRKLFSDNFEVFVNETYLVIKSQYMTFFTKLINGKFPDYKRIIPDEYKYIIALNKNSFLKAIKQINIISNDIKITIDKNKMYLESISDETFEAKTDIEIESNLENFVFAVNSRFLLDFLNVSDDNIEICLNEENIPFTLREKNFETIIMPLSI